MEFCLDLFPAYSLYHNTHFFLLSTSSFHELFFCGEVNYWKQNFTLQIKYLYIKELFFNQVFRIFFQTMFWRILGFREVIKHPETTLSKISSPLYPEVELSIYKSKIDIWKKAP